MEILDTLNWTQPRLVNTKFGERMVRSAEPTSEFWDEWRNNRQALKEAGVSLSKDNKGSWSVTLWEKLDEEEKEKTKELSRALDADVEIPIPLGLEYLPYQKAGIAFSREKNALIADEMGLGKTIQAIGVINTKPKLDNILIIVPSSLRINWERELTRWLVEDYTIGIVNRKEYPENTDIVIINYDVVSKHRDKLLGRIWDLMIIDEAHYIKNNKAQRTQAILGKGKQVRPIPAKQKVFLTGTPILNKPIELWTLISALDPKRWNSWWSYSKRYCAAYDDGFGLDVSGASNLEELQDRLRSTIMIRRLKKDVLTELPAKRRQVIELPADANMRKLIKSERKSWEVHEDNLEDLRVAVELSKVSEDVEEYREAMRQLKESTEVAFSEMAKVRQEIALLKVPYVIEHLKNTEEKVVVFAHHKAVIAAMKEALGDSAVVLVGDTKMDDRQKVVDEFQQNPKVKYFLGSIKAAGVGITLTSASHVVFAELDWGPGNISQAEDRCHRIGQQNSVLVQHLVIEGSIDALMAASLVRKQEIIDKALDDDAEVVYPEPSEGIKLPSFTKVNEVVEPVSAEEKADLLSKLRILASFDGDRALVQNNIGFNKFDGKIGHSLAERSFLTDKQAILARRLVNKYRRQLE